MSMATWLKDGGGSVQAQTASRSQVGNHYLVTQHVDLEHRPSLPLSVRLELRLSGRVTAWEHERRAENVSFRTECISGGI